MLKLLSLLLLISASAVAGQPPAQITAKLNISAQKIWVSKDVGKDTNDGTLLRPYKTIGAAITAANAIAAYYKQVIIHISPPQGGTGYNENLTLSQQGVTLQCDNPVQSSRACLVSGTLTVNLTGTSGGANFIAGSNDVYVNGIQFASGASNTITFSGTVFQRLILSGCYVQASGAMAVNETNTGVNSELRSYDTTFENNSATIPTVTLTSGRFWLYGTIPTVQNDNAAGPSVLQNGPSSMIGNLTQFVGQYQLTDNTATATFNLSTIASGSASCIATPASPSTGYALLTYFGCNSTNTNSITGSGVVVDAPSNVRFGSSGDIVSTVTQALIGPGLPQGEMMLGAGAVTGTNVLLSIKGGHMKVAQTTAPTASPSANAGTSATCTLTNGTDAAGIVNLTEGSASWASGTQCTVTFNKAYGVAPVCTFSSNNAAAASHLVTQQVNFITTTTTMLVSFGAADSAATAYKFFYNCVETQ